jgi:hypothetical protein
MEELNSLQKAVLVNLLAGDHPVLAALRAQAERAQLVSRRYTGVGFFCDFTVPLDVPPVKDHLNFELGDVYGEIAGLQHGAGFVLFVRSGYLNLLEGFSYDESWPEMPGEFKLSYLKRDPTNPAVSIASERRDEAALFDCR